MAKVIQGDRDAAANFLRREGRETTRGYNAYVDGTYDASNATQAFAAHREASTAKLEADMAELVELLERASKAMSPHYVNWHDAASNALTRIQGEYRSGEVAGE